MNKVYYIHSEEMSGIKPTYAAMLCTWTGESDISTRAGILTGMSGNSCLRFTLV